MAREGRLLDWPTVATAFGRPAHLWQLWERGLRPEWVALDTETSGLFADDGARVSIVSVAWPDPGEEWGPNRFEGLTWREEEIVPGWVVPIASVAWPFDQGVQGKPEAGGVEMLWDDAPNLGVEEWAALCDWVVRVGSITMHHSPFDVEKMQVGVRRFEGEARGGGVDLRDLVDWDTQNVNSMAWGWEPTSLKPTCTRLWPDRWPADELEQKRVKDYLRKHRLPPGRYDLVPWDIIGQYADDDARMTAMLRLRQEHGIANGELAPWLGGAGGGVLAASGRRLATSRVLGRMTARGLPYAATASHVAAERAAEAMRPLAEKLPFDPSKDADAKRYFFGRSDERTSKGEPGQGYEPYAVTEKGGVSLNAEALQRMVLDSLPWAAEFAAWRRADTARSMWYEGYALKVGADGRLRTYFRQNGARSSRFSVERVNLQAIPQDYRFSGVEILAGIPTPRRLIAQAVAEDYPGWKLYELDLEQAELRIASLYAGEYKMIEMIRAGEDMHGYTTTELFRVRPGGERWGEYRGVGKRANFSLCFGSGGTTFRWMLAMQAGIRWTEDQCNETVWKWRRLYPAFVGADGRGGAVERHSRVVRKRMLADLRRGGSGVGYISFRNRERRWFQPYEEPHKAFNQRVQGDQAQFNIDWLLQVDERLRGYGLDQPERGWPEWRNTRGGAAGLLLPIHDSLVLLLPDGAEGRTMAESCADIGRELWAEWFPGMPGAIEVKEW